VHPLTPELKAALKEEEKWAFYKLLGFGAVNFVSGPAALATAETGVGTAVFGSIFWASGSLSVTYEAEYFLIYKMLADDPPDARTHQLALPRTTGSTSVRDYCSKFKGRVRRRREAVVANLRALLDDVRAELAADKAIVTAQNRFGTAQITGDGVAMDLQYAAVKTELGIETDALAAEQADDRRLAAAMRAVGVEKFMLSVAALRRAGEKNTTGPLNLLNVLAAAPPLARIRSEYLTMNGFDLAYLVEALARQHELSTAEARRLEADASAIRHAHGRTALRRAIGQFVADTGPSHAPVRTVANFLEVAARGIRAR
jgi:hypothetical protein